MTEISVIPLTEIPDFENRHEDTLWDISLLPPPLFSTAVLLPITPQGVIVVVGIGSIGIVDKS